MVMNDPLANCLSKILNAEGKDKRTVDIHPASKIIKGVLALMKERGYIGDGEIIQDNTGEKIVLTLLGKVNKCGVIKPRYAIKITEFEKYEKKYLLAKNFGILILSTSQGLLTHEQAKEKGIGGRLIAYCY